MSEIDLVRILKEGQQKGLVTITEKTIEIKEEAAEVSENPTDTPQNTEL